MTANDRDQRAAVHDEASEDRDRNADARDVRAVGSAEVCVYLDFWGEQASPGATPAAIAQIIDYWAVQYDAQLIANWGTMLQFVVARPPDNLEQAWQLAVEQDLVAGHTLANPGVPVREHARS